jgi:hypothetical protein
MRSWCHSAPVCLLEISYSLKVKRLGSCLRRGVPADRTRLVLVSDRASTIVLRLGGIETAHAVDEHVEIGEDLWGVSTAGANRPTIYKLWPKISLTSDPTEVKNGCRRGAITGQAPRLRPTLKPWILPRVRSVPQQDSVCQATAVGAR